MAGPNPIDARVVWTSADRLYLAAADSIALAPGDLLTLVHRKKTVATAVVTGVPARDLGAARLTSGSLARARLDRLGVLAERPPLRPLPVLRVGLPGRGRSSLLFECAGPRPNPRFAGGAYRVDSLAANAYRLVRPPHSNAGAGGPAANADPWPDTILVRLFGDAADEEIALERGELDLAIFWPGEASSRLRSEPRGRGLAYGTRSPGALVAAAAGDSATWLSPDHPALSALNAELFRGDLAPWPGPAPPPASPYARPLRFEVDPACPGRLAIERFLARSSAAAGGAGATTVRLFWSDSTTAAPEAGIVRLFAARCPIAAAQALMPYVNALGTDALAGLLECAAETGPP